MMKNELPFFVRIIVKGKDRYGNARDQVLDCELEATFLGPGARILSLRYYIHHSVYERLGIPRAKRIWELKTTRC
jgi:hypothetical protein